MVSPRDGPHDVRAVALGSSNSVSSASRLRSLSWKVVSRAAVAVRAVRWWCSTWPLRWAIGSLPTASRTWVRCPCSRSSGAPGPPHPGGHPAWVHRVAGHVGPASGRWQERGWSRQSAALVAFTLSAAGGATTSTVKLLTVEQADAALGLSVDYVSPGGSLGGPERSRSGGSRGLERLQSNSGRCPSLPTGSRWPGRQEMARR